LPGHARAGGWPIVAQSAIRIAHGATRVKAVDVGALDPAAR
jgi:hypothetical protein